MSQGLDGWKFAGVNGSASCVCSSSCSSEGGGETGDSGNPNSSALGGVAGIQFSFQGGPQRDLADA
eukprot:5692273-Karenia_brevis.AAC.1